MFAQTLQIHVSHCFGTSCQTLYERWLDPEGAARWLLTTLEGVSPTITMECHVGGRFQIIQPSLQKPLVLNGQFLQLTPSQKIIFSLEPAAPKSEPDLIQLTFEPHPFGCELHVSHQLQFICGNSQHKLIEHWTNILMRLAADLHQPTNCPPRPQPRKPNPTLSIRLQ